MPTGRLSEHSIAAVREAADIEAVISPYVTLKRAGSGSMKGLCPFHDEKSGSFNVSTTRNVWHCFGCQEGGDAIGFIQQIEGIGFIEAVERLAETFRIDLTYEDNGTHTRPDVAAAARRAAQEHKTRMLAANAAAADWYAARLASPQGHIAQTFLAERHFNADHATQFNLGYAPEGWDNLIRHLVGQGFTAKELIASGLASQGKKGPIDRFRNRLIFPIRDLSGEIIGFGARKLADDDNGPKYLNTPETPLYKKSKVLFGLDKARKAIALNSRVVIVEGYTDVMACHLEGETTAVASCGTALGEDHLRILARLLGTDQHKGEIVYAFDGDAAGQKAALRAFALDPHLQTRTMVAIDPEKRDPCEIRIEAGRSGIETLFANRSPLAGFVITSTLAKHNLDTVEGRSNAVREVAPILAGMTHREVREDYIRLISRRTGTSPDDILTVVADAQPTSDTETPSTGTGTGSAASARPANPHPSNGPDGSEPAPTALSSTQTAAAETTGQTSGPPGDPGDPFHPVAPDIHPLAREALKMLIQAPNMVAHGISSLDRGYFAHPTHRALFDTVVAAATRLDTTSSALTEQAWAQGITTQAIDHFTSPTLARLITELSVEPVRTRVGITDHTATATFAALTIDGCQRTLDHIERVVSDPAVDEGTATAAWARYQPAMDTMATARALLDASDGAHH